MEVDCNWNGVNRFKIGLIEVEPSGLNLNEKFPRKMSKI